MSVIGKIAYLGFAGVPPTILGLAFILSPNVLYPFYAAAPRVTPWRRWTISWSRGWSCSGWEI